MMWARNVWTAVIVAASFVCHSCMGVDCSQWQMCDPLSRRILFIMDASLSISEERFNNEMMNFVINTFCGFRDTRLGAKYEAGVITFNQEVIERVPFQEVTPDQFETLVNSRVRNRAPLKCCTSHAEAAILAKELFEERDAIAPGFQNIAFFITDGTPFINYYAGSYGIRFSNLAKNFYNSRSLNWNNWGDPYNNPVWTQGNNKDMRGEYRMLYATRHVPLAMQDLKQSGVRVFFIGVPHSNPEKAVNINYFNGRETNVCYENNDVSPPTTACGDMVYSPLVSDPVDDHAFRVDDWTMPPLVEKSLDVLCKPFAGLPTPQPTNSPSPAPTPLPTYAPIIDGCPSRKRDLMILVDTSESMEPLRYRNEMMSIVKTAVENLDFEVGSRVGVATFGNQDNTRIRIPLQTYTSRNDFESDVDTFVRPVEMQCCTNFAEAFDMVRAHFQENFIDGHDKILLIITDGTPFQNYGRDKWEFAARRPKQSMNRCEYATEVVPRQAGLLQLDGVRIVLAGVPNVWMRSPMERYFTGALDGHTCCVNVETNKACLVDNEVMWCSDDYDPTAQTDCRTYNADSVVSPGPNNIFTVDTWDVGPIQNGIRDMICWANPIPTPPPTTPAPSPPPIDTGDGSTNSLPGFDFIVVLDSSDVVGSQQDRCGLSGTFEECHNQLLNFANQARRRFIGMAPIGDFQFAGLHSDCFSTDVVYGLDPWKTNGMDQLRIIRQLRNTRMAGAKCGTAAAMKVEAMVNSRADTSRPVVILFLTHQGDLEDLCSTGSAIERVVGSSDVTLYAATVSDDSEHLRDLTDMVGSSGRVFDAFNDIDTFVSRVEALLSN